MSPPIEPRYKRCFVPGCDSNTVKTPEKKFFCVPFKQAMRIRWFDLVRPGESFNSRLFYYCCQDHFYLKDLKYTLKGLPIFPLQLKTEVVPRTFKNPLMTKVVEEVIEEMIGVESISESNDVKPCTMEPSKMTWSKNSKENCTDLCTEPMPKLRRIDKNPVPNYQCNVEIINTSIGHSCVNNKIEDNLAHNQSFDLLDDVYLSSISPGIKPVYTDQQIDVKPQLPSIYTVQQNIVKSQFNSEYAAQHKNVKTHLNPVFTVHQKDFKYLNSLCSVRQKDVKSQFSSVYVLKKKIQPETESKYFNYQKGTYGEPMFIIKNNNIKSQSGGAVYKMVQNGKPKIIEPSAKDVFKNFMIDNNVQHTLNNQSELPKLTPISNLPIFAFTPKVSTGYKNSTMTKVPQINVQNNTVIQKPVKKVGFFEKSNLTASSSSNISQSFFGFQIQNDKIELRTKTKSTMVKPTMVDVACQCDQVTTEDRACPPVKIMLKTPVSISSTENSKQILVMTKNKNNILFPMQNSKSPEESKRKMEKTAFPTTKRFININLIEKWIGKNGLEILVELLNITGCSLNNVMLTLTKIQMNKSFVTLAREFKLSTIQAKTIFNTTIGLIANYFEKYIYVPSIEEIKEKLPIVFREKYSNVCAIIDIIEVDFEKPLDPLEQPLTTLELKKFCTFKYLIAYTPDGHISFVSSGYGGDISDISLFRDSKIISILPLNSIVMTNREFDKDIEMMLGKKKCQLISLTLGKEEKSDKNITDEDLNTIHLMSLRFHVEETIKKIQAYRILTPDAGLDLGLMSHMDNIVTIVVGLVNENHNSE